MTGSAVKKDGNFKISRNNQDFPTCTLNLLNISPAIPKSESSETRPSFLPICLGTSYARISHYMLIKNFKNLAFEPEQHLNLFHA